MKRFQFRAAAVLELRRRQHDTALVQLTRAEQQRDRAARVRDDAEHAVACAEAELRERLTAGADIDTLIRHRNWITHQHAAADGSRRAHGARQQEVERATADVRRTHRQLRAIERLRDRAWRLYRTESARLEAIEMDRLGISRFTARRSGGHQE